MRQNTTSRLWGQIFKASKVVDALLAFVFAIGVVGYAQYINYGNSTRNRVLMLGKSVTKDQAVELAVRYIDVGSLKQVYDTVEDIQRDSSLWKNERLVHHLIHLFFRVDSINSFGHSRSDQASIDSKYLIKAHIIQIVSSCKSPYSIAFLNRVKNGTNKELAEMASEYSCGK